MNNSSNPQEIKHNVVLLNGNEWEHSANCIVLINVRINPVTDLPTPDQDTFAIKLNDLIYKGLQQTVMDKLLGKQ